MQLNFAFFFCYRIFSLTRHSNRDICAEFAYKLILKLITETQRGGVNETTIESFIRKCVWHEDIDFAADDWRTLDICTVSDNKSLPNHFAVWMRQRKKINFVHVFSRLLCSLLDVHRIKFVLWKSINKESRKFIENSDIFRELQICEALKLKFNLLLKRNILRKTNFKMFYDSQDQWVRRRIYCYQFRKNKIRLNRVYVCVCVYVSAFSCYQNTNCQPQRTLRWVFVCTNEIPFLTALRSSKSDPLLCAKFDIFGWVWLPFFHSFQLVCRKRTKHKQKTPKWTHLMHLSNRFQLDPTTSSKALQFRPETIKSIDSSSTELTRNRQNAHGILIHFELTVRADINLSSGGCTQRAVERNCIRRTATMAICMPSSVEEERQTV